MLSIINYHLSINVTIIGITQSFESAKQLADTYCNDQLIEDVCLQSHDIDIYGEFVKMYHLNGFNHIQTNHLLLYL